MKELIIQNHDDFINEKQVNLQILVLTIFAAALYLSTIAFAHHIDETQKILSIITIVSYCMLISILNMFRFFENKIKFIYFTTCTLPVMLVLYIEKGHIDNVFNFFPIIALSVLYFKYEVLISSTASVVAINLAGYIWNRSELYPTTDLRKFLSMVILILFTGAFLSYIIRRLHSIVDKAKDEERKTKKALDSLERTLVYLDNAYSKLRETQTQLVQNEKMASLGMLVAGVAHEINNPLGAINCNVDLYKNIISRLKKTRSVIEDTSALELVSKLENANTTNIIACDRILEIVKSLRNFARLDESEYKEADIHAGIDCTLILLGNKIKNKVNVVKEYGNVPPVTCYPNQLNQVFMNLFANAIDAIPDSGTIWITTYSDERYVHVKIKDNGSGIEADNIQKIFDPGFTTKGVGIGTGLGLSIVYNIIEKHNGKISVKSEIDKGTEFHIQVPIKPDKE